MSKLTKALTASAGNAGAKLYVEDAFSTFLYEGNGSTKTITNGIDLAGEGGLVWSKSFRQGGQYILRDSERGPNKSMYSSLINGQDTFTGNTFNSDGFTTGTYGGNVNQAAATDVSWTFRKAEKFFDVVTFTGDGQNPHTISHNLDSVPGFIMVKRTDANGNWCVAAFDGTNYRQLTLNNNDRSYLSSAVSNIATSTTIDVGYIGALWDGSANVAGGTYVAYLFASDAGGFGADGSENIIKCGGFSGNGSVTVGFEPQWLLIKSVGAFDDWELYDNMRGIPTGSNDAALAPNNSGAQTTNFDRVTLTATGFNITNMSGGFIYIAIR